MLSSSPSVNRCSTQFHMSWLNLLCSRSCAQPWRSERWGTGGQKHVTQLGEYYGVELVIHSANSHCVPTVPGPVLNLCGTAISKTESLPLWSLHFTECGDCRLFYVLRWLGRNFLRTWVWTGSWSQWRRELWGLLKGEKGMVCFAPWRTGAWAAWVL